MKKLLCALLAVILILGLAAGCSPEGEGSQDVKIGMIGPTTGDTAFLGEQMKQLMDFAQKEINDAGGIGGKSVTFYIEDDAGTSSGAVTAAQKLVDVTKVDALVGPLFTSCVLAVKPIVNEAKIPTLIPTSADKGIFEENGFVFSLDAANEISVKLSSQYLYKEKGFRKAALLGNYNDQTVDMFKYYNQFWKEYGGEVVYESTFNSGTDDFRTELAQIKQAKPDVLWVRADAEEFMSMTRQIVELGLDDVFICTDYQAIQGELFDTVGKQLDGRLIYTQNGVASDDATKSKYEDFNKRYTEATGAAPEAHIALMYDCIHLLLNSMETSKASTGEEVRKALAGQKDFVGVTGYITFDEFGKSEGSSTIVEYKNGESVPSSYKLQ